MSALAMILTAAMVVPGDGPEKVSGETKCQQKLDLKGEWMTALANGEKYTISGEEFIRLFKLRDLGDGHLRLTLSLWWEIPCVGIYRQEDDRVLIWIRWADDDDPRPLRCRADAKPIILHRVKPRK